MDYENTDTYMFSSHNSLYNLINCSMDSSGTMLEMKRKMHDQKSENFKFVRVWSSCVPGLSPAGYCLKIERKI